MGASGGGGGQLDDLGRVVPAGLPLRLAQRPHLVRHAVPDGRGVGMGQRPWAEIVRAEMAALERNPHRQLRRGDRVRPDAGCARTIPTPSCWCSVVCFLAAVVLGFLYGRGGKQAALVPPCLPHRAFAGRLFAPGRHGSGAEAPAPRWRRLYRARHVPDDDRPEAQDRKPPTASCARAASIPDSRAGWPCACVPPARRSPTSAATIRRRRRCGFPVHRHRHRARRFSCGWCCRNISGCARRSACGRSRTVGPGFGKPGAVLADGRPSRGTRGVRLARLLHDRRLDAGNHAGPDGAAGPR